MKRLLLLLLLSVVCSAIFSQYNIPVIICDTSVCDNRLPFVWHNISCDSSGEYTDTVVLGGDTSLYILNLTVNAHSTYEYSDTKCQGRPYDFNGMSLYSPGTYQFTTRNYLGCDSIITLNLTVMDTVSESYIYPRSQVLCRNEQPQRIASPFYFDSRDSVLYQWYESTDGSNWESITGATDSSYTPSQDTTSLRYFKVSATSVRGCGYRESFVVSVSVYPQFQAGEIDINGNPAIVCRNESTANQLTGTVATGGSGNYSYQWYKSESTATNWIPIPGQTNIDLPAGQIISQNTSFRRIDKDITCDVYDTTNVITLDVYQSPTKPVLAPYTDTICYNSIPQQLSIATQSTGYSSADSVTYQWEYSDDNINFNSLNVTGLAYTPQSGLTSPRWYRVKTLLASGCDSIYSDAIKVNVFDPLDVQVVPGSTNIYYMTSTPLSVSASGAGGRYSYKWYESSDISSFGTQVGTNSSSLNTTPNAGGTRYYRCVVTSVKGCGSDTSDVITINTRDVFTAGSISLNGNPAIVCRNESTANQLTGTDAVGGSGNYLYQWQKSDPTGTVWTPIQGQTNINLPAGQTISQKTSFRRIDRDTTYKVLDTTIVLTIDVYQSPTKPVLTQYTDTVCYNEIPRQLSIDTPSTGYSSVDNVIYKWEYSDDNINFNPLNVTGLTYTPQSGLTSPKWYRVKAVLLSGCDSIYSDAIKVNVYDPLGVQVIAGDTTVCYETSAELSVLASGVDHRYNYVWYESSDASSFGTQVGTNSSLNTTPNTEGTRYYRCLVTSTKGCGSDTSDMITVVTRTQFQAGEIDINGNPTIVCRNTPTANQLTASAASGGSGNYSYQWQKSDSTGTYWTAISGKTSINLPSGQTISQKTSFRRIDKDNTCSVYDTTNVITIDVYQSPTKPVLAPYTDTICFNSIPQQLSIATQSTGYSSVDSVIYQWEYSNDNVNFYSLSHSGSTYTPQSLMTAPKWYRVKAVLLSSCDSIYSDTIKVNVYDPLGVQVIAGDTTVCYMTSAALSVMASGVDHSYNYIWYESSDASSFGTQVGTNSSLNTTPNTEGTRYYRCVVTSIRGCGSATSNVITVTTRPQLRPGEISLQVDSIVCSNDTVVNPFSATPATGGSNNISYQWQYRKNEGWISIPGENQSTLSQFAIETTTYFRRMAIDGICGDTSTNVIMIDVFSRLSQPELSSYSSTVCYGSVPAGQLSITTPSLSETPEDSVAYSWEYTTDLNAGFSPLNETGTVYQFNQNLTDTTYYRVVARLVSNCDRKESDTVRVCVYSQLNVSGISGTNAVCYNTPTTLSVTASGVDGLYDYQWYRSSTPAVQSSWTTVGTNSSTYTTAAQTASGTLYYKCSVTSRTGCGFVWTPSPFAVETKPVLSAGSISGNDTICFNAANYQITSSQPASGSFESKNYYRWEKADGLSGDNWVEISNETVPNLVNSIALSQSTRFRRIAYNSTCDLDGKPSNTVTIYVRDSIIAPVITSVPDSICYGGSHTLQMSVRPPDGTLGEHFTFEWYESETMQRPSASVHTEETYNLQNLTKDHYYWVEAVSSRGCDNVSSAPVHIHVMQPLKVVISGPDSTLCYNTGDTIHAMATGSKKDNYHYLWQQTTDTTKQNSWVTVQNSQDVPILNTPQRTDSLPYFYRCVVTNSYCLLEFDTSNIMQINTFKKIIPGTLRSLNSVGYCRGEEVEQLTFDIPPSGDFTTIEWQRRDKNSSKWTTVKPESPATHSAMVYDPGSSLTDTVYFRALLSNKCGDDSYTEPIIVCINPLPEGKTIHCDNSLICSNDVVKYYIAESDFSPRYNYEWAVDEAYGTIQGKDDGREVEIIWNAEHKNAKVSLTITDTARSLCSTKCDLPDIKVSEGVDTVNIYRKRGSNILYCVPKDSSYYLYYYQWVKYENGKTILDAEDVAYDQGKRYIVLENVENDLENYTYGLKLTQNPKDYSELQCSSFSRYWGDIEPTVSKASASRIYASTHIRDVIHLRIENPDKLLTDISIYSVSGTLIYTNTLGDAEYIDEEIPVTLVSGVYLLHVRIGDEVSTIKLMAE